MMRIHRACVVVIILALLAIVPATSHAATLEFADAYGFLHIGGSLDTIFDRDSVEYFSTLDASNHGSFGWSFTNIGETSWSGVSFFGFLDADIDRDQNTAMNEYGAIRGLMLPPSAPEGAMAATSCEIDEPGYLFGDIIDNLFMGMLDGTNGVGIGSPDDVSLALGFYLGAVAPGETATVMLFTSQENIGGLWQYDPDSDFGFYFNGYAMLTGSPFEPPVDPPGPAPIPEPSSLILLGSGIGLAALVAKRRQKK